ncbi:hypothetical protein M409DRAFT_55254 [Zasmidium cellare ATCC 36951]|uniref:Uncharacterized protein n=1 Tax=Zasmidium cellare ATCC 36951 TaxID=1080233 RepID=A0A6A6CKD2_ZASCE|nr:uncharacterized protein M409DRAFT_55254 [Zasmidium cellare ATCC 36951]KAF2165876.1 hypothetical protein M409DRAFT_55254 [Zasmidium cellare ATCC 36951]
MCVSNTHLAECMSFGPASIHLVRSYSLFDQPGGYRSEGLRRGKELIEGERMGRTLSFAALSDSTSVRREASLLLASLAPYCRHLLELAILGQLRFGARAAGLSFMSCVPFFLWVHFLCHKRSIRSCFQRQLAVSHRSLNRLGLRRGHDATCRHERCPAADSSVQMDIVMSCLVGADGHGAAFYLVCGRQKEQMCGGLHLSHARGFAEIYQPHVYTTAIITKDWNDSLQQQRFVTLRHQMCDSSEGSDTLRRRLIARRGRDKRQQREAIGMEAQGERR